HRALGLSSALIGSGMGIDYALYKKTMATVDSVGEDKEMEMKLLKQKFVIEYVEDAFVYDEKTQKSEVFINQRRRWLAAQLSHFKEYFFDGLLHLFRFGNLDYFDKVLQMIQPPRILLLGLLLLVTIFYSLLELFGNGLENRFVSLNYSYWLILLIISALTAIISVPKSLYTTKTFIALLSLPKGFILMIISLLKIKGATKRFIHTTHSHAGKVEKKH
ncbi:MAG: glycosyltransferase family 2 protein, partial [Bacteroidales bacterium]|nr:glycosyltransferase family 2 protein [Bacteroidales bacterium]